jgi:hypothetical protein
MSEWPSGALFATTPAPIVPLAPPRFFDDERFAELLGELVGDQAADDVGGAAGREADHDAHRLRGVGLRGLTRVKQGCFCGAFFLLRRGKCDFCKRLFGANQREPAALGDSRVTPRNHRQRSSTKTVNDPRQSKPKEPEINSWSR